MLKVENSLKLDKDLEQRRKVIVHSFSLARNIYTTGNNFHPSEESDLKPGAEFLEVMYIHELNHHHKNSYSSLHSIMEFF